MCIISFRPQETPVGSFFIIYICKQGTEAQEGSVCCRWLHSCCLEGAVFNSRCSHGTDSDAALSHQLLIRWWSHQTLVRLGDTYRLAMVVITSQHQAFLLCLWKLMYSLCTSRCIKVWHSWCVPSSLPLYESVYTQHTFGDIRTKSLIYACIRSLCICVVCVCVQEHICSHIFGNAYT